MCEYDFTGRGWHGISSQARNFVSDLIKKDPEERPTAEEAMQNFWLNKQFSISDRLPDEDTMDNIQATLQNFSRYKVLKKIALMVIAHKSTSEEIGILRKAFRKYDEEKNGSITLGEFRHGLAEYGYSDDEIQDMFQGADIDKTGSIKYTEFLAATIEARGEISEERLAEAFDRLDSDDSGYISLTNLRQILGQHVSKSELQSIIAECDLTKDNKISYEEFLALWDQHHDEQRQECLQRLTSQKSKSSSFGSSYSRGNSSSFSLPESNEHLLSCSDEPKQPMHLTRQWLQEERNYRKRKHD
uniref:EF-hand domain-containing protein n=2 Tax=Ditylum brightwellii TaxID=49249 RepID=A0A7S4RS13_9STRA